MVGEEGRAGILYVHFLIRKTEFEMFQETITWDLHPEPSTGFNLYVLFLLVSCVVASAKLIKAWRGARLLPSRHQIHDHAYVQNLDAASNSLKHWIGCTFLVCGYYLTSHLYYVCFGLQASKNIGNQTILLVIQDSAVCLAMTFLAVLFLFVVRWVLGQTG